MSNIKVTTKQIELLLEFLEQHHSLALGRVRGKEGNALSHRLWRQCADSLNTDIDGAIKSAQDWKKYYNHYKSRVKSRARALKKGIKGTGGGPAELTALTPLEERLYAILGGCSSPLPIRQNPLRPSIEDPIPSTSREAPALPEYDDDGVEENKPEYFVVTIENDEDINAAGNHNIYDDTTEAEDRITKSRSREQMSRRPRKRRRQLSSTPPETNAFQEASQQLAAMEAERIEVNKQLVCATNRQAAALEEFVGQVKRFVDLYEQQMRIASPAAPATATTRHRNHTSPEFRTSDSSLEE